MKQVSSLDVTEDRIVALQVEAEVAGDQKMVKTCQLARAGNVDAFRSVLDALRDAAALEET